MTAFHLPGSVEDKTSKEDDEEMMRVPEDFKVAASDDLHGRGDDEDQGQSDDDACKASDGGEDEVDRNLLRMLRHKKKKKKVKNSA